MVVLGAAEGYAVDLVGVGLRQEGADADAEGVFVERGHARQGSDRIKANTFDRFDVVRSVFRPQYPMIKMHTING